mmetsp:Transcript_90571/g.283236  ORF Transcript_90571/g.283236 Transcript_90571/m.283236 type:complete len:260 (-) Transcript_90571:309-1088(-)
MRCRSLPITRRLAAGRWRSVASTSVAASSSSWALYASRQTRAVERAWRKWELGPSFWDPASTYLAASWKWLRRWHCYFSRSSRRQRPRRYPRLTPVCWCGGVSLPRLMLQSAATDGLRHRHNQLPWFSAELVWTPLQQAIRRRRRITESCGRTARRSASGRIARNLRLPQNPARTCSRRRWRRETNLTLSNSSSSSSSSTSTSRRTGVHRRCRRGQRGRGRRRGPRSGHSCQACNGRNTTGRGDITQPPSRSRRESSPC